VPEIIRKLFYDCNFRYEFTVLLAIRCLVWPTQADEWPERCRQREWLDQSAIDTVVTNGCDLIQMAHRSCIRDEFMRCNQWRFSFSRAESFLLNSWTPKQQVIYNTLQFFLRKSGLCDLKHTDGYRLLTSYSIKTLMLWCCEQKVSCWWVRSNIVELCYYFLKILRRCCRLSSCKAYFIQHIIYLKSRCLNR
jgi:hypothetical protein